MQTKKVDYLWNYLGLHGLTSRPLVFGAQATILDAHPRSWAPGTRCARPPALADCGMPPGGCRPVTWSEAAVSLASPAA